MIEDLKRSIAGSNFYQGLLPVDFLFSPRYECFYVACSKSACSKTKMLLGSLQQQKNISHLNPHGKPNTGLISLDELSTYHAERIISGDGVFRFAFVRNPYDRIISCYLSRINQLSLAPYDNLILAEKERRRNCALILSWLEQHRPGVERQGKVSFSDFITYIVQQKDFDMDRHWLPQASSLHIDKLHYDFIGRVESYVDDFSHVCEKIGAFVPRDEIGRKINSTVPFVRADYFTRSLSEAFFDRYRYDFIAFNYEKNSWLL